MLPVLERSVPGAVVIGADRAEGMIRLADARFPRVVLDGGALSFASGSFDAVTMTFMLFHLPDPVGVLQGVRDVLKARGRLGLATWEASWHDDYLPETILNEELDKADAEPAVVLESSREQMNTPEKAQGLLERAGFVDVEVARFDVVDPVTPAEYVERRRQLGLSAQRFGSLSAKTADECAARVLARLDELSTEEMTPTDVAILSTARSP